jgi:mycothiol synthase
MGRLGENRVAHSLAPVTRAATIDHADAVVELVSRCNAAGLTSGQTSSGNLLRHWQDPHRLQGDTDILVVEPDGRVVGYLAYFQYEPFTVFEFQAFVDPDYVKTPVFESLLHIAESRARDMMRRAPDGERVYLNGEVSGAATLLHRAYEDAGFEPVRVFLTMSAELNEPPPPAVHPEGVQVRQFVPGQDERAVWAVSEAAWVDHWRFTPMPYEEFVYLRITAQPGFDPSLWYLAIDGDEVVGVLLGLAERAGRPNSGWVSLVAVLREHRGRGIGLALLREAFGEFYRRGYREVALVVDSASDTGANRLYERAGMREVDRALIYEKVLRG